MTDTNGRPGPPVGRPVPGTRRARRDDRAVVTAIRRPELVRWAIYLE